MEGGGDSAPSDVCKWREGTVAKREVGRIFETRPVIKPSFPSWGLHNRFAEERRPRPELNYAKTRKTAAHRAP